MRRFIRMTALTLLAFGMTGCVAVKRDRCYLAETRYMAMRAIFEETWSYQRAGQAMNDAAWSHCEINTFRYRLRKDLGLVGEEYEHLFAEYEPRRRDLDFNPGRVEKAVE